MYDKMEKVEKLLKENDMGYLEFTTVNDDFFGVLVEWGDWKHDHLRLKWILREGGYDCVDSHTIEEDGSDCYSAIHHFKW